MRVRDVFSAMVILAITSSTGWAQTGQPPLTVVSRAGAYMRAQMLAAIGPYREASGNWVAVEQYTGGLDQIKRQVDSLNVTWDVVDIQLTDAIRACNDGLLEPIDSSILAPPPGGGSVTDDFFRQTLQPCAVGQVVVAGVVAYTPSAFAASPTSVADLFNPNDFPGRRALQRTPRINFEWALLADGVPEDQIYRTLETEAGVERALDVLDRVSRDVIWWRDPDRAVDLLVTGAVTMASAPNGRVTRAIDAEGANLAILWDHNIWDATFWAIPRGTARLEGALDFIRFATAPERLAKISDHIAYGPVRRSAMELVDPEIVPTLPTSHRDEWFEVDYEWWAENEPRLSARFETWLRTSRTPIYDFNPKDRS